MVVSEELKRLEWFAVAFLDDVRFFALTWSLLIIARNRSENAVGVALWAERQSFPIKEMVLI